MRKAHIIFLLALFTTAVLTFGCSQKDLGFKKAEETPTPEPPKQTPQNELNSTLSDIESQMKELQDLEKSLEIINNMTFQI